MNISFAIWLVAIIVFAAPLNSAAAGERTHQGTASGQGMLRMAASGDNDGLIVFNPKFSVIYEEPTRFGEFTWIVLTEKRLPESGPILSPNDVQEALTQWCKAEKSNYAAVRLEANGQIHSYLSCVQGDTHTAMVSSVNGLDVVLIKFEQNDPRRKHGTITTGEGNCGSEGQAQYCTKLES